MRHNRRNKRFGRSPSERRAMLENIVSSLLSRQEITTTLQKAKEAKRLADRVITLGKKDTLHARRQVFGYLQDHGLTSRIFKEVAPRFKNRNGGYTRILQLQRRKGDGAQLALLELTEKEIKVVKPKAKPEKEHKHKHVHDEPKHEHKEPPKAKQAEKEAHGRPPETKKPQKGGFFKNLSRFFKNKGGG